jgi:hypothetical protein
LIAYCPTAVADPPTPGARYDRPNDPGTLNFIRVAPDGKSLANYVLQTKARCSDRRRHLIGVHRAKEPTSIAADG